MSEYLTVVACKGRRPSEPAGQDSGEGRELWRVERRQEKGNCSSTEAEVVSLCSYQGKLILTKSVLKPVRTRQ